MRKDPNTAWKIAGIIATLVIVLALPIYHIKNRPSPRLSVKENHGQTAQFVGSEACRDCHRNEYDKWMGSHHQLAMAVASEATVLGDFADAEFRHFDVTNRFYRRDGRFFVTTQGPGGQLGEFEITHTFGSGEKVSIAVKFAGMGPKILDPRLAPIEPAGS